MRTISGCLAVIDFHHPKDPFARLRCRPYIHRTPVPLQGMMKEECNGGLYLLMRTINGIATIIS